MDKSNRKEKDRAVAIGYYNIPRSEVVRHDGGIAVLAEDDPFGRFI